MQLLQARFFHPAFVHTQPHVAGYDLLLAFTKKKSKQIHDKKVRQMHKSGDSTAQFTTMMEGRQYSFPLRHIRFYGIS